MSMNKNMKLYGTPQMVKQFREQYKKADGELPDFMETLELMKQAGALSPIELPAPALNGNLSKREFMEAYDQIPFDASMILNAGRLRENPQQAGAMFRNGKDVVCVQHFHDYGYHQQPVSNFFAVTYMFEGKCVFLFDGQKKVLTTGDLIIVTPRFGHYTHMYPDSFAFESLIDEASFHIVFNDFLSAGSKLSEFFEHALISGLSNYCILHGAKEDDELSSLLQFLVCECNSDMPYANSRAVSYMKLFLSQAFRKYGETIELYRDDFHKKRMGSDDVYRYIINHFTTATLEETAAFFHYNASYMSRYIQEHFHRSFTQIVTELRIDRAKEYLRYTNTHIMDIALLVGYDSADHFSRMFRKYTGMSPAAYRKIVSAL